MTRQSLKTADSIPEVAGITLATKRKRIRQWDVTHNRDLRSYRGIPPELHTEITAIADKLHIPTGDVARKFFEYSLEAYHRGDLKLTPMLRPKKMTLYPGESTD